MGAAIRVPCLGVTGDGLLHGLKRAIVGVAAQAVLGMARDLPLKVLCGELFCARS